MPELPSIGELFNSAKSAVADVVQKDASDIAGFSETQLRNLANHGLLLAKAAAAGAFETEDDRKEFLDGYAEMMRNFVRALVGLIQITIEKVWNALVGIFWGVIEKAAGFALPRPGL